MKRILFSLFLVAAAFALPASACEQSKHGGTSVPYTESTREPAFQTAFPASGQVSGWHRCECSSLDEGIVSAITKPTKAFSAADIDGSADAAESTLLEVQFDLETRGRFLSAFAPPRVFPLYLLTARLRR